MLLNNVSRILLFLSEAISNRTLLDALAIVDYPITLILQYAFYVIENPRRRFHIVLIKTFIPYF